MSFELNKFDVMLIFVFTFGLFLIISSFRTQAFGMRFRRTMLVPQLVGITIIVLLAAFYSAGAAKSWSRITDGLTSIVVTFAVAFVAVAVAETMQTPIVAIAVRGVGRARKVLLGQDEAWTWAADLIRLAVLAGTAVVIMAATFVLQETPDEVLEVAGVTKFPLPSAPTALVFHGEQDGYVALGDGRIMRFELPSDSRGQLSLETVAEGLTYPHGVAVFEDRLYVTHQAVLDCEDLRARGAFAGIRCAKLPGMSPRESQIKLLYETRGEIVVYDIRPDSTLSERQVLLSDLPVANGDHAINAIVAGPDGRMYVSIGGLDVLAVEPDLPDILASIADRPNFDMVGTVISFLPDGSDVQVFARGMRNVYGLTFDGEGRLFGVDNDGPTQRGWRFEEVLHIKLGADYGHPFEGTFDPIKKRTDDPIWVADSKGSAGIQWAPNAGFDPGLIVGGVNKLVYLKFAENENAEDVFSSSRIRSTQLLEVSGFVTGVAAASDRRLLVAAFGLRQGTHSLQLIQLESKLDFVQ